MEKIDILLWIGGGGFSLNFALMLLMWNSLNSRLDKLEDKINKIDKRLVVIETIFHMKECSVIQNEFEKKKVS